MIDEDAGRFGAQDGNRPVRLLVCAAPGSGKGTLLEGLFGASRRAAGDKLDGLTYKSYASARRRFGVADVPATGEHRLSDLAAASSAADSALLIVDATTGLLRDVRRDGQIAALLGVTDLTLAINKMDLVGYSQERFREISDEYRRFSDLISVSHLTCIPIAALAGENIAAPTAAMPWFAGPTLIQRLDSIEVRPEPNRDATAEPAHTADQVEATVVWTGRAPMLRGRSYAMRIGARAATATVAPLRYRLDLENGDHVPATKLESGEIGVVQLGLGTPVAFDAVGENRSSATFALADRMTGERVGTGLIVSALRRSDNLTWQTLTVKRAGRARLLRQQPTVLWLTGLSGAGKSTLANEIEVELHRRGHLTFLLDGDNVRLGLNADLGFTDEDRAENIRRVAEVARLMADAGLIVIVSFISPFRAERDAARSRFDTGDFLEIHVDVPLAVAEQRDPKGLYRKARRGDLVNFTGIDSPYEPPERPEIRIDTTSMTPESAARIVIDVLERSARLQPAAG